MRQTGLLIKFKETDYLAGSLGAQKVMPSRDWRPFKPNNEKQYNFSFDTKSCTTFSVLNDIEFWLKFLKNKFTANQIKELKELGYIENEEFNFSDRFTAIMSGTTEDGNYHQKVLDSVRNHGLLPEKDLPFIGNSWAEYHDKTKITSEMIEKAKKFRNFIKVSYEQNSYQPNVDLGESLEYSPLLGAIPFPAYHAVVLPTPNYVYDTYEPFLYERKVPVHYSYKMIVEVKPEIPPTIIMPDTYTYKYFKPSTDPKMVGVKHELMLILDKVRELAGVPITISSGLRTVAENQAVGGSPNSAHLKGLAVDLDCKDNVKRTKMLTGVINCGTPVFLEITKKHLHIDIDSSIHPMGMTIVET